MGLQGIDGLECVETTQSVSYVMADASLLSVTGYKVLCSQEAGHYVPCVRSRLNGREKITYLTGGLPSLVSYMQSASSRSTQKLLRSFVDEAIAVRDNGFLSVQNLVIARDKIYVDPATGKALVICLPLSRMNPNGDIESAREVFDLCAGTYQVLFGNSSPLAGIDRSSEYQTGNLQLLKKALLRGVSDAPISDTSGVDESSGAYGDRGAHMATGGKSRVGQALYRLNPLRGDAPQIRIAGPSCVVGRSPAKADQVIPSNTHVSKAHCRLRITGDGVLSVEDLGSANGTFVNGNRLVPGRVVQLAPGDDFKIADIDYSVLRVR